MATQEKEVKKAHAPRKPAKAKVQDEVETKEVATVPAVSVETTVSEMAWGEKGIITALGRRKTSIARVPESRRA